MRYIVDLGHHLQELAVFGDEALVIAGEVDAVDRVVDDLVIADEAVGAVGLEGGVGDLDPTL